MKSMCLSVIRKYMYIIVIWPRYLTYRGSNLANMRFLLHPSAFKWLVDETLGSGINTGLEAV